MGKAFEGIEQGLRDAIAHARGQRDGVQEWKPSPVDVAAVRDQLGYTQEQFASRFGISVATLRHWERGDRRPNGPALVLLNLIARDPQAVGRLLSA
jgi:putative transcriptional regulator